MKKNLLLLTVILSANLSFAQSFQDEVQIMQSLYGMEKRELVDEFIEFNESQKSDFWTLYDAYEVKRKDLGMKTFKLIQNYVDDYGEINPADVESMMKQIIPLRKDTDKLIDSYYHKIKNKTDPVVAVQFYQLEHYLSDLIRIKLLEELFIIKNQ